MLAGGPPRGQWFKPSLRPASPSSSILAWLLQASLPAVQDANARDEDLMARAEFLNLVALASAELLPARARYFAFAVEFYAEVSSDRSTLLVEWPPADCSLAPRRVGRETGTDHLACCSRQPPLEKAVGRISCCCWQFCPRTLYRHVMRYRASSKTMLFIREKHK